MHCASWKQSKRLPGRPRRSPAGSHVNLELMLRSVRTVLVLAATLVFTGGCSNDDSASAWGASADAFFADWSQSWSAADPYDIVRFYDPDVAVMLAQDYRSLNLNAGYAGTAVNGDGRGWLVAWIDAQFEPRERILDGVYLANSEAMGLARGTNPVGPNRRSGLRPDRGRLRIADRPIVAPQLWWVRSNYADTPN